ncbi:MAG: DUF2318 domain-containing protein [Thermodesulfobacteriota bacterium]
MRTAKTVFVTVLLVAAPLTVLAFWPWSSGPQELASQEGVLRIPVSSLGDGRAHHYQTRAADGTRVIFFAVKDAQGRIRTAVDACDVCYKAGKGFVQDGSFMVCENCGQRFAISRIGEVKGGCNPAPLPATIEDNEVRILTSDIDLNSGYAKYRRL